MLAKLIEDAIKAHAPMNLCDQCLVCEVKGSPKTVADATSGFGRTSEFSRYLGVCSRCGEDRPVTRRAA